MTDTFRDTGLTGEELKNRVRNHWETETCGTRYGDAAERRQYFAEIEQARYEQTPFLRELADFPSGNGQKILEIGVGAGTDFHNWVRNGAQATGIDLTEAAINLTRERLSLNGVDLDSVNLQRTDAENLPFANQQFDLVYSWGVLHHSPDTPKAFSEVFRVLKPGGEFRGMIYHVPSWTGWMLWVLHGLAKGKPFMTPRKAIFDHLESPGTKAYTIPETRAMLQKLGYQDIRLETRLGGADMMTLRPGTRYQGRLYKLLWTLYPRWLVRLLGHRFGLNLLIRARKDS